MDEIQKLKENLPPPPPSNETSNNTQNQSGGKGEDNNNDSNEQNSSSGGGNSTENNTEEDPYNGLENEIRGLQQNTIDQRQKSIDEDEYMYGNRTSGRRNYQKNW